MAEIKEEVDLMSQTQTVSTQDILRNVRIFRGLDRRYLAQIAKSAHVRSYAAGETIVSEGENGIGLYVISSGEVDVYQTRDGEERQLRVMRPGEVFGQLGLLTDHPRTASVRAVSNTECLVFTAWNFRAMLAESPEIAGHLLGTLAQWLVEAEDRAAALR
jgi:CRP/FNR family cyclic AMP-dependent transcriptional regulator